MSLKPQPIDPVPEETARMARAAYPKGNTYLQLRDEFGTIYEDEHFKDLSPHRGQPAEAPWRLALVASCNFVKDYLIGKPPMPCVVGWTGNTCWDEHGMIAALMPVYWSNFGNAFWSTRRRPCLLICF